MPATRSRHAAFLQGTMAQKDRLDHFADSFIEAAEEKISFAEALKAEAEPPWDGGSDGPACCVHTRARDAVR